MIPLLSLLQLLSSNPSNNFVPLKTYISENAKIYCKAYWIYEDIQDFSRPNIVEKSVDDFFQYLDSIGVEHTNIGGYYFFKKKPKL